MATKATKEFMGAVSVAVGHSIAEVHADDTWLYITQIRADERRGSTVKIPMDKLAYLNRAIREADERFNGRSLRWERTSTGAYATTPTTPAWCMS